MANLINKIILTSFDRNNAIYQATIVYTTGQTGTIQLGVNAVNDIFGGLYDQTTYTVPVVLQDSATQQFNGTIYPYQSQGGTLSGNAITNNVKFDVITPGGASRTGVVLSPSDYQLLQNNIGIFTISNAVQGNYAITDTYQNLALWLSQNGSTNINTGTTPTGQAQNIIVTVKSTYGTQQQFVISVSDYAQLQAYQQFILSSNVTTQAVNSTYASIVSWLSTNNTPPVSTLSPNTGAVPITTPQQALSTIQQTVTQSIQVAAQSGVISPSAAVQAIQAVQNNTVDQTHVGTIQTSLQNSINRGTMTVDQANTNLNTVTNIPNPMQQTQTQSIKQNPFQLVVGAFAGLLTFSFLTPKGGLIKKKLRSSKRSKK